MSPPEIPPIAKEEAGNEVLRREKGETGSQEVNELSHCEVPGLGLGTPSVCCECLEYLEGTLNKCNEFQRHATTLIPCAFASPFPDFLSSPPSVVSQAVNMKVASTSGQGPF